MSDVQEEVDRRRRCYQEAIVRRLYVRVEDFEFKAGWVDAKGKPTERQKRYTLGGWDLSDYNLFDLLELVKGTQIELKATTCDVLGWRSPAPVPCDKLGEHPVAAADTDKGIFQAIARLDLAVADPQRQFELFQWRSPNFADKDATSAFEEAKVVYWERVCASAFTHLEILKDTADFKAANLIRLLYLAGDTPERLRTPQSRWRDTNRFDRDVNFAAKTQERIEELLREFKYWGNDPFFVDGAFNGADKENICNRRTDVIKDERREAAKNERKDGLPLSPEEIENRVNAKIDEDLDYEMTFWSENHQVLFASAEYLAGQWMPDEVFRAGLKHRAEGPQGTRPGDLTGEQRMRQAKVRLVRWLDDRLRLGFSEWNALPYYEEDIEPLLNLADFCLDEEIRVRSQLVLDLLLFDLARFNHRGNFGVSAGRCYYNQKMCGYDPGVGDLIELLFGTRDGVIVWDGTSSASAFASSRGYSVPDVLVKIGQDRPRRLVDRSRVSLGFDEASIYGIGFQAELDALFWWSRSAFVTKQMVRLTRKFANVFHLNNTPPFAILLPLLDSIVGAGETAVTAAHLVDPVLTAVLFVEPPNEIDVVDSLSPLTEGSVLTRANLYTYRNRDAMLSSVQNWRTGQFNFQTQVCQATLSPGATVWTTHPSAGGYVNLLPFGILGGILATAVSPWLLVEAVDATDEPVELIPHSGEGPNWWTGTVTLPRVVQRDGAAILAYQPSELMRRLFGERTHAWFPKAAFDNGSVFQHAATHCNVDGGWTFGKVGDGYVGLFSARPVSWTTAGPWAEKELLAEAGRNIFIIQVGNKEEFGSYDSFVEKVRGARVHVHGLRWAPSNFQCSYDLPSPGGGRLELHYDENKVRYNGVPFSDDNFPRFETPYVKCGKVKWGQYRYTIAFGEHTLTHDFRELRTKIEGAQVTRSVDSNEYECDEDAFWIVSDRGAQQIFPENTIEACQHAVEQERTMALCVDACLTADDKVVLWRDWNPDLLLEAALRQLGTAGVGAYRPRIPKVGDPLRKEVIQLTLAELRAAYGYVAIETVFDNGPAPFAIPTLSELVIAAGKWPGLRHLLVHVRMPGHQAEEHAAEMLRQIVAAFDTKVPFDLTLLINNEEVLVAMKATAARVVLPVPLAFCLHCEVPPDIPDTLENRLIVWKASDYSATNAAISHRNTIASLSLAPTPPERRDSTALTRVVSYDVARMEAFNLNPRENQGHQIERLLVSAADFSYGIESLVGLGMSGIITNDVPTLRMALQNAHIS